MFDAQKKHLQKSTRLLRFVTPWYQTGGRRKASEQAAWATDPLFL